MGYKIIPNVFPSSKTIPVEKKSEFKVISTSQLYSLKSEFWQLKPIWDGLIFMYILLLVVVVVQKLKESFKLQKTDGHMNAFTITTLCSSLVPRMPWYLVPPYHPARGVSRTPLPWPFSLLAVFQVSSAGDCGIRFLCSRSLVALCRKWANFQIKIFIPPSWTRGWDDLKLN